jgi:hypothetical protein
VKALSSDANGPSGGAMEADANAKVSNVRMAGNAIAVNSPNQTRPRSARSACSSAARSRRRSPTARSPATPRGRTRRTGRPPCRAPGSPIPGCERTALQSGSIFRSGRIGGRTSCAESARTRGTFSCSPAHWSHGRGRGRHTPTPHDSVSRVPIDRGAHATEFKQLVSHRQSASKRHLARWRSLLDSATLWARIHDQGGAASSRNLLGIRRSSHGIGHRGWVKADGETEAELAGDPQRASHSGGHRPGWCARPAPGLLPGADACIAHYRYLRHGQVAPRRVGALPGRPAA